MADDLDTTQLARRLRVAAAWAGRCTAGAFRAGDGESSHDGRAGGRRPAGRVLAISVDEEAEMLRQAEVTLLP